MSFYPTWHDLSYLILINLSNYWDYWVPVLKIAANLYTTEKNNKKLNYLKRFFSGKNSVAHFALDSAGRAWTFVNEVSYNVGTRSTTLAVLAVAQVIVWGQVEAVWRLEGRKPLLTRRRFGSGLAVQVDRPQSSPPGRPRVHPVNVRRRKNGIGRWRK